MTIALPLLPLCLNGVERDNFSLFHIIIIFIYCSWVVTGGSGYFTSTQNTKLVTNKFKSVGLREKHVVATWNLENDLSICL